MQSFVLTSPERLVLCSSFLFLLARLLFCAGDAFRFSADILPLLDRGIVYAIAHIRGGGEGGRAWYEAARFETKPKSFEDFIACAELLVSTKRTTPNKLSMEGRSAGGLLMGSVMNMRPDLFRAVIAGVPFVDVLNTMSDA